MCVLLLECVFGFSWVHVIHLSIQCRSENETHVTTSVWLIRWDAPIEEEWRAVFSGFKCISPLMILPAVPSVPLNICLNLFCCHFCSSRYCSFVSCFTFYSCLPLKYRCSLSCSPFSSCEALVTPSKLWSCSIRFEAYRVFLLFKEIHELCSREKSLLEAVVLL